MKMSRIRLHLLVILTFSLLLAPCIAVADDGDFTYSILGDGVSASITGYTGTDRNVTVPAMVGSYQVTEIGENAFAQQLDMKSVVIPEGVTKICRNAFFNCVRLRSITIPDSTVEIESSAFVNCVSLTDVVLPAALDTMSFRQKAGLPVKTPDWPYTLNADGETITITAYKGTDTAVAVPATVDGYHVTAIGGGVFRGMAVTSVALQDGVVTLGADAFRGCTALTSVSLPSTLETISTYAFENTNSLKTITLPESLRAIDSYAFQGSGLVSVTLPDGLTQLGEYVFYDCKALAQVDLGNGISLLAESVFMNCSSLDSISIPASVSQIGISAFAGCKKLATLTLNEGLFQIGRSAFLGCTSLSSLEIPSTVQSIAEDAFASCGFQDATNVILPPAINTTSVRRSAGLPVETFELRQTIDNQWELVQYNGPDTALVIPESYNGKRIVRIGGRAFREDKKLTSVTLPDTITRIGPYAFADCDNLSTVVMGKNVSSVAHNAFSGCDMLTSVTFAKDGFIVSIGQDAFSDCPNLVSVCLPDGVDYDNLARAELGLPLIPDENLHGNWQAIYATAGKDYGKLIIHFNGDGTGEIECKLPDGNKLFIHMYTDFDKATGEIRALIANASGYGALAVNLALHDSDTASKTLHGRIEDDFLTLTDSNSDYILCTDGMDMAELSTLYPGNELLLGDWQFIPSGESESVLNMTFEQDGSRVIIMASDDDNKGNFVAATLWEWQGVLFLTQEETEETESFTYQLSQDGQSLSLTQNGYTINLVRTTFEPSLEERMQAKADCAKLVGDWQSIPSREDEPVLNMTFKQDGSRAIIMVPLDDNEDQYIDVAFQILQGALIFTQEATGETTTMTYQLSQDGQSLSLTEDDYTINFIRTTFEPSLEERLQKIKEIASRGGKPIVGDMITFGAYPQTAEGKDNTPIEWQVLDQDGDKLLIISRYGLDMQQYNTVEGDTTWAECTLRTWLNDTFLNRAFTPEEQEKIVTTIVPNDESQCYRSSRHGSRDTQDKIFLLSCMEVEKYFDMNDTKRNFNGDDAVTDTMVAPTAYALSQGADVHGFTTEDGANAGWWWLRSPGLYQYLAAYILPNGKLGNVGQYAGWDDNDVMVRPALWVCITDLSFSWNGINAFAASTEGNQSTDANDIEPTPDNTGLSSGEQPDYSYRFNADGTAVITGYHGKETSLVIPAVVEETHKVTSIGYDAFRYNHSITSVHLPEGITSIEADAFTFCSSLTNIEIPESVTYIGENAFHSCGFTSLYLPDSITQIGKDALPATDVTYYVNQGSYAEKYCNENGLRYRYRSTEDMPSTNLDDVMITVGTETVTRAEYEDCLETLTSYYSDAGYDITNPSLAAILKENALKTSVEYAVMDQKLAEMGLALTEDEKLAVIADAKAQWDSIITDGLAYYGITEESTEEERIATTTKMLTELESEGFTAGSYQEDALATAAYRKLYNVVTKDVTISDEDVVTYYNSLVEADKAKYENDAAAYEQVQSMNQLYAMYDMADYITPLYYTPTGPVEFTDELCATLHAELLKNAQDDAFYTQIDQWIAVANPVYSSEAQAILDAAAALSPEAAE